MSELQVQDVKSFYDSDVVIDTFNRAFRGQWHTTVELDLPGAESLESYLCKRLDVRPEHRVLDFGSGVGVTSARIAATTGCSVRGLNISEPQIGIATELARKFGVQDRVGFDLYPGRELPYVDAFFDRVFFFESVCHVPHKELLFRELYRVLKPGGFIAGQDWMLTRDGLSGEERETWIRPIEVSTEVQLESLGAYARRLRSSGFQGVSAFDLNDVAPRLGLAFPHDPGPIEVTRSESYEARLRKGDFALSAAFRQGLFTVGLVMGKKGGRPERTVNRLVTPDELELDANSKQRNLSAIDHHVRRFGLENSRVLEAFRDLTATVAPATLETSVQVEGEREHAGRFNLFYHGTRRSEFTARALSFFEQVQPGGARALDTEPIRRIWDLAAQTKASLAKVVLGMDLREEGSRCKLWLMIQRGPELVEACLAESRRLGSDDDQVIRELRFHEAFLVGFDLRFDGKTSFKLYPDVRRDELQLRPVRERLQQHLSPKALTAMDQCSWTHLYFSKRYEGVVLQFHPLDPDAFVQRYLPERGRALYRGSPFGRLLDMVVSIPVEQLEDPKTFTLYEMPLQA